MREQTFASCAKNREIAKLSSFKVLSVVIFVTLFDKKVFFRTESCSFLYSLFVYPFRSYKSSQWRCFKKYRSRNFREFREFCPNSWKFKMPKILYWPIRDRLCTRNFSIFSFSLQICWLTNIGLKRADISVIRKRGQLLLLFECSKNVWCSKTRPNTTKAWNNKVFSIFYFYLDPNVSFKPQKKSTFLSIRESLRRENFYFGWFAKVYAREMQKFLDFFRSRKFLLLK